MNSAVALYVTGELARSAVHYHGNLGQLFSGVRITMATIIGFRRRSNKRRSSYVSEEKDSNVKVQDSGYNLFETIS